MALNKVEICGVNTSKLPVLKAEEKRSFFKESSKGTIRPGSFTSKAICGLF